MEKKFMISLPEELRKEFKIHCVKLDKTMNEKIKELIIKDIKENKNN